MTQQLNPWNWPDSPERRAELGHQDEPDVPGYCTCGEFATRCPEQPRQWVSRYGRSDEADATG